MSARTEQLLVAVRCLQHCANTSVICRKWVVWMSEWSQGPYSWAVKLFVMSLTNLHSCRSSVKQCITTVMLSGPYPAQEPDIPACRALALAQPGPAGLLIHVSFALYSLHVISRLHRPLPSMHALFRWSACVCCSTHDYVVTPSVHPSTCLLFLVGILVCVGSSALPESYIPCADMSIACAEV